MHIGSGDVLSLLLASIITNEELSSWCALILLSLNVACLFSVFEVIGCQGEM